MKPYGLILLPNKKKTVYVVQFIAVYVYWSDNFIHVPDFKQFDIDFQQQQKILNIK